MKEFLIGLALVVAGAVLLITNYQKLGDAALKDALALERPAEEMKELSEKDPAAFVKTFTPCLERRWTVLRVAEILDSGYFDKVSKETVEKYKETELLKNESFGHILHARAVALRDASRFAEAFPLFKLHRDNFGNTPEGKVSAAAVSSLGISHGMY